MGAKIAPLKSVWRCIVSVKESCAYCKVVVLSGEGVQLSNATFCCYNHGLLFMFGEHPCEECGYKIPSYKKYCDNKCKEKSQNRSKRNEGVL